MATNPQIDKAPAVGSETTNRATAAKRSQEVASRAKHRELVELFGKLELADDYDYQRERDRW